MGIATFLLALPLILSYPNEATDLGEWMSPQEQRQMGFDKLNENEKRNLTHWIKTFFDEKLKDIGTARLSITAYNNEERAITLNDGSAWEIHGDDSLRASWWKVGAKVKIISGDDAGYPYIAVLVPYGEVARARLISKPLPAAGLSGESHWVAGFDVDNNVIRLEDGTKWHILPDDISVAKEWLVGDTISIYTSESSKVSHVLVNSLTKQKVRVSRRE